MTDAQIFIVGALLERIIIISFAGISILLGYRLFKVGVVIEQSAVLENQGLKITLQKVGPGVFFSLFGTAVLLSAFWMPVSATFFGPCAGAQCTPSPSRLGSAINVSALNSYKLSDEKFSSKDFVQSLNTILSIPPETLHAGLTPPVEHDVQTSMDPLRVLRDKLVSANLQPEAIKAWKTYGRVYAISPDSVPADARVSVDDAAQWYEEHYVGK